MKKTYELKSFMKRLSKIESKLPPHVLTHIKEVAPKASETGIKSLLIYETVRASHFYVLELRWLYEKTFEKKLIIL